MKLSEVFKALEEGQEVIYREKNDDEWMDISEHCEFAISDLRVFEFKIKPKPLELWVNIFSDGTMSVHDNKSIADCQVEGTTGKTVHMKEVIL